MTVEKNKLIVSQAFVKKFCKKCVWGKDAGGVIHCLRMPCAKLKQAYEGRGT